MSRREREQKPSNFLDEAAVFCLAVAVIAMTPLMWLVDKGGDMVTGISGRVLDKLLTPILRDPKGKKSSKGK